MAINRSDPDFTLGKLFEAIDQLEKTSGKRFDIPSFMDFSEVYEIVKTIQKSLDHAKKLEEENGRNYWL